MGHSSRSRWRYQEYRSSCQRQIRDIDLFDTSAESIKKLKTNKKVICYFSAGSREDWRPDASDFDAADYRNPVEGGPQGDWPGEHWLDVKSDNVKKIMKSRIELAKTKGCHAVDPDNVDGFVSLPIAEGSEHSC
jgi:hypothetical protein